ncbi:hypothetical protein PS870_03942 [Pseudomonas fluorescens]|uniref:Uncharacterized protein n=1 Tax=Pseudomonas fluorescens TaxID=294 RepID=A0A5E7MFD0_PSEFL|nr:hypothetical protein PS870_03942 [Pseudomonas fluorescens]VVQ32461.1 hypothetical protein PS947_02957 [Pseudomonas fluorescens]
MKIIFFTVKSMSDDSAKAGFVRVSQVRQCFRGGTEMGRGARQWNEYILPNLLSNELIRG